MNRLLRRGAGLALVVPALVLMPSPAQAAASVCAVSGSAPNLTVTVTYPAGGESFFGLTQAQDDGTQVLQPTGSMQTPLPCTDALGGSLPVADVSQVVLQAADPGAEVHWDLSLGLDWGSTSFALHNGPIDSVYLRGSESVETWQLVDDLGFDLDADETIDLTFTTTPARAEFDMWGGDDAVDLGTAAPAPYAGVALLLGRAGDDTLTGGSGADQINGEDGDDSLVAGGGDDRIWPDGGLDTVVAGSGADFVNISPDAARDVVDGGTGVDQLYWQTSELTPVTWDPATPGGDGAAGENDAVTSFHELYSGGPVTAYALPGEGLSMETDGPGTLVGNTGDDVLTMINGGGATFSYARAAGPVFVSVSSDGDGQGFGIGGPDVGFDQFHGVYRFVGSPYADVFDLTQIQSATVRPGQGSDQVHMGGGGDLVQEPVADGADELICPENCGWDYRLRSTPVSVTLDNIPDDGASGEGDRVQAGSRVLGGLAADTLVGSAGIDSLNGHGGNDQVFGRGGEDFLEGGSGADTINGGSGVDELRGDAGGDTLFGNGGEDILSGGADADRLDGGLGDDDEFGEDGNDTFVQGNATSDNGSDVLDGGVGTDTVSYLGRSAGVVVSNNGSFGDGNAGEGDNVRANVEKLVGTNAADTLTGAGLADQLFGNAGNDTLRGNAGTDTIDGGKGLDRMYGDAGNDLFYAKDAAKDTISGGTGTDKARRDAMDVVSSIEGTF